MVTALNRLAPLMRLGFRYWDVMVASGLLLAAAGYWYSQRPERQFRAALADVERQDWDAVRSRAAKLERSKGYFPHAQLLWGIVAIRDGELTAAIEDLHDARQHSQTRPLASAYVGEAWY